MVKTELGLTRQTLYRHIGPDGKGWYSEDNPAAWAGNLDALLVESPRRKKLKNRPSLPFHQVGVFIAELRQEKGIAARAMEFGILTAARSGEIRGALGDEIDLDKALWTIPATRMKVKKEHVVRRHQKLTHLRHEN